jgi:hypothetical protein
MGAKESDVRMLKVLIILALNPLKNPGTPSLCQILKMRPKTVFFCCLVRLGPSSCDA